MPFYPELPQPIPRSGMMGLAQGWGAAQDLQSTAIQQQMARQRMQQQKDYMEALKTAQQTGDTSGLMTVAPDVAINIQKAKDFQQQRALDYTYQMADQMKRNPAVIPQVRAKLKQMGVDDSMFPEQVTPEDIDSFKTNYEKMHGIKSGTKAMYDPTGKYLGQIPQESVIAPATGMPTTILNRQGQPVGQTPAGPHLMLPPEPKVPGEKEFDVVKGALREKLGREPTYTEMKEALLQEKKDVASAGAVGRGEGESAGITPGSRMMNAKAWILGTKPMTSFKGTEKAAIADLAYNAGFDTQDMASIQANYKALTSGKTKLASQQALIEAFTNNAKLNMELGNKISEGVNRLGSPKANEWLQWFQGKIMGQEVPMNEDVRAFNAIVGPTANEWAKVMSTASGAGGVLSDAARKETWDLLNISLNKSQFRNVGQVMMQELDNRGKGIRAEHQRIDKDINTITKYVDDKFAAAFPELVKTSPVQRPGQEPASTMPAPGGGNATYTGNRTPDGYPIYKLPDGTFRPWKGGQ